ncbi:MAG TPA: isoprenylcysteine carboxylmethyltransferase family protein [Pyrinomonadaceae bacterium]|nr:isoprenylcysteine carboxylmethyltransferase family protein [Pyrinomonadaceae bacterium]
MRWLELKIPPLIVVIGFALMMFGSCWLLPAANFVMPAQPYFSLFVAGVGILAIVSGFLAFRRGGTTVDPMSPDKASSVVRSGIYRLTRNPMYLGMLLILTAWSLYLANFVSVFLLAGFVVFMTQFQIKPEERILRSKFGKDYEDLLSSVRRWI